MANEKNINSRIVHKHDTEANWNKATNFSPKQGEIIVYDVDANYSYERFKIGDGIKKVNELPFANANIDSTLSIEGAAADAKVVGKELAKKAPIGLFINITWAGETDVYKADRTLAEVHECYQNGGRVVISHYTGRYECVSTSETAATFTGFYVSDTAVTEATASMDSEGIVRISRNLYVNKVDTARTVDDGSPQVGQILAVKKVNFYNRIEEYETVDLPSIDTSLSIKGQAADAKATGDAIASIPNADWNQNDATQPSYIENRTHWIEPVDFEWRGESLFNSNTLENIPEGKIYLFECATTDKDFNVCTLSCSGSSWVVPVNKSKWSTFTPDSWVSFGPGAVSVLLDSGTLYLCSTSAGMTGMGVYAISDCGVVNYLPAAYIPSTIARTASVVTSVNGQTGAVTVDIPTFGALATKDTATKTDLESSVQASLDKADTALQSFTETDPTVPAWAKAATKPSYTASEIGLATETWTFTLEDGSIVTKAVYVG